MVLTRNQHNIVELFEIIPYYSDDSDSKTNMSSSTTVNDNANQYAQKITLTDKTGLLLFCEACKGLDNDNKLLLQIENDQAFKEENDRAASKFCWGAFCSDIADDSGVSTNLLTDYKNLTMSNLKTNADATWGCNSGDYIIPAAGSSFDELQHQRRIRCSMMAKWI